jgi:hypothetical protein
MKNTLRHIITACILLSVAALASTKEPAETPASTLLPTYQAETIVKTGADPYLLGLVGTVLLSVVTLVIWVVRGNKKTIDKMIDGAEKRAAEDREMYRAEQALERASHERVVNAIVENSRRDVEKLTAGLEGVQGGQARLEREIHELRGRLE